MIFRQLFDATSSTYTYLLGDATTGQAVLIDPVLEQVRRDLALAADLNLAVIATLDTHVHADHVTGAAAIRKRTGAAVCISRASGATEADRWLDHGDRVAFGGHHLEARATPGHTAGCMTFVLDDASMAFTGDCLLIRGSGRTDFQGGSAAALFASVHEQIYSLPPACLLYPGHDYRGITATSVDEERRCNPRLADRVLLADFEGHMRHLRLAHPKRIDEAVPANLRCGSFAALALLDDDPDWAPLAYSFTGIWEIAPDWVEANPGQAQIIDVREPEEYAGPLGHIAGSRLIPLPQLETRCSEIDPARPVIVVCRSGSRSAQACVLLAKAGMARVANLAGGMLRWRAEGYAVSGGSR
ncbi:MAG: MBL fold metallo-hydrolase [Burkholderiales bacterium]|nr:MBL fold metallo-hydrolase [Burkholderiales bacterium]